MQVTPCEVILGSHLVGSHLVGPLQGQERVLGVRSAGAGFTPCPWLSCLTASPFRRFAIEHGVQCRRSGWGGSGWVGLATPCAHPSSLQPPCTSCGVSDALWRTVTVATQIITCRMRKTSYNLSVSAMRFDHHLAGFNAGRCVLVVDLWVSLVHHVVVMGARFESGCNLQYTNYAAPYIASHSPATATQATAYAWGAQPL